MLQKNWSLVRQKIFPFSTDVRPTPGSTQVPTSLETVYSYSRVKRPGLKVIAWRHLLLSMENTNFVSPCAYSNIYPTRCNVTQFIYIWKLLYMFRVVPPPIIRSAYNCIYSIWYSNSSTIAAGSSNGVTNTRCCRYSYMRSWWWVEVPLETCIAVSRQNKLCKVASC